MSPGLLALSLGLACLVDAALGEPPAAWHPVVWVGRVVGALRARLPRRGAPAGLAGLALALALPAGAALGVHAALAALAPWPAAQVALATGLLTTSLSLRMLGREARALVGLLPEADGGAPGNGPALEPARARLAHLCSRDAARLDAPDLCAATVESVAENTSDAFVAPVFWTLVLGVPGAWLFRTANTLDSMVGYRGEYEWLGKASARLDDLLCWVPARLTALGTVALARVLGLDTGGAWRTWRRDARRTESPNAGHPMAAAAGALGVELSKPGHYVLGAGLRRPGAADVERAVRLSRAVCVATATLAVLGLGLAAAGGASGTGDPAPGAPAGATAAGASTGERP